ncbi:MAG: cysteine desulfurase, partial [Calditrichaeota bacterium]
ALASRNRGKHIITSRVEHKAVLNSCKALEKLGFEVTYLPVDRYGRVSPEEVRRHLRKDTILISIIYANNEIGTINPMREIGAIAREAGVPFHSDAVQAFGKIPISVRDTGIDLLSLSSHKIYGPKGVGALYVRRGTPLWPLQDGGGHEKGRRAGTENVPGIVGLAAAARLAFEQMETDARNIGELRDYFWNKIQQAIPDVVLNGHPTERLYHNLNVSFPGCDSDTLLVALDMAGIAASSGSACDSGVVEPSHVLQGMGAPKEVGISALRFTLGRGTTREDLDYTVEKLQAIVAQARSLRGRGRRQTPARRSFN